MVVELIQAELRELELAHEAACKAVVLIPEGGGDYHSTGLVEVMGKAVAVILNRRFTTSIHGFRAAYMGITRSPLPQNRDKLPLPLFGGKFLGNFACLY